MDPKLWFWTLALANLAAVVAIGRSGISALRRGEVALHRRRMLISLALVFAFLGSYAMKVRWLGREDRSQWTGLDYAVLYTHELFVTAMLIAGGVALWCAWRFRGALGPGPSLPAKPLPGGARHRVAGRIAAWSGLFAFVTAIGVWAGMWLRSS